MTRYVLWPLPHMRYDLLEWPSRRVLASGPLQAMQAAARLLGVEPSMAHVRSWLPQDVGRKYRKRQ